MIVSPDKEEGEIGTAKSRRETNPACACYAASAKKIQGFCALHHMNGDNLVRRFKFSLTAG